MEFLQRCLTCKGWCAAAMSFLGIDAAKIGHMWYLSNNPATANFDTGDGIPRCFRTSVRVS